MSVVATSGCQIYVLISFVVVVVLSTGRSAFAFKQHPVPFVIPRHRSTHFKSGSRVFLKADDSDGPLTLEYSHNFQRHVVRNEKGDVLCSFQWMEEALNQYPGIAKNPVKIPFGNQSFGQSEEALGSLVAGCGLCRYENLEPTMYLVESDEAIQTLFESRLKWFPGQVDRLLRMMPSVRTWDLSLLEERISFMLSPLPPADVLDDSNKTAIDWPVQYSRGYGAGMDIGQLSHALQTCPDVLLRREVIMIVPPVHPILPFLYTETPSIVIELTQRQMDVTGATNLDCAAYSFFHWKGWDYKTLRILVQAIPSCISMGTETTWETLDTKSPSVRKKLLPSSLCYLRLRLQLRPSQVVAMIRTHSRLSYYPVEMLARNLDALQLHLGMISPDVQRMVLRMPSLLGMSVDGIIERVKFWKEKAGLTAEQLKVAAIKQPSMLQYSVKKNLEPKLSFFRDDLELNPAQIADMSKRNTQLWGRSLDNHLRPLSNSFVGYFNCSAFRLSDLGQLWAKAPELANGKWEGTFESKLSFLETRLGMDRVRLQQVVRVAPRILMQSIETSLEPKIKILESVSPNEVGLAVESYPSLLWITKPRLSARMERVTRLSTQGSLLEGLALSKKTRGAKHSTLYEERDQAATAKAGSATAMAADIRKRFRVVDLDDDAFRRERIDSGAIETPVQELKLYISGRAFPSENRIRGARRSGGLAFAIPQFSTSQWKQVCRTLWKGQRFRFFPDKKTVLLGYAFTRPSSPRCSLYAALQALRIIRVWWQLSNMCRQSKGLEPIPGKVSLVTDSTTVVELFRRWETSSPKVESGTNLDIVAPLASAYYGLVSNETSDYNLTVHCRRSWNETKVVVRGSTIAAKLMYNV